MKCLICNGWIIKRAAMYCPKHLETYGDALPWEARRLTLDLSKLSNTDLNRFGRFIDYMLIRVDASELDYWERAAESYNIETLGRQALAVLKRLPYGLEVAR